MGILPTKVRSSTTRADPAPAVSKEFHGSQKPDKLGLVFPGQSTENDGQEEELKTEEGYAQETKGKAQ